MKSFSFPVGDMPAIGLGTWKMEDGIAEGAVKHAIDAGYRHIDCAPIYLNERDVGSAFKSAFQNAKVTREELWITSKLWCNRHRPDLVEGALKETLCDLNVDYLDLFMIHWPVVFKHSINRPESATDFVSLEDMPLTETWAAMEDCVTKGLCRNLGVCNFNIANLQLILDECKIKPAANQVECHPYLNQQSLKSVCDTNDVQLVAYSPLGSGDRPDRMRHDSDPNLFDDGVLKTIADSKQIGIAQLMLAWAVQRGSVAIPKSTNPQRLQDNLAAGSIELSDSELSQIDGIQTKHRFVHGRFWEMEGGPYTAAGIWGE